MPDTMILFIMMTREERAKQFLPFDAMKGLQEALRDREEQHLRVPKRALSDEETDLLSRALCRLEKGMTVSIEYYHAFHTIQKEGRVTQLNFCYHYLKLEDEKIFFDDIYQIHF